MSLISHSKFTLGHIVPELGNKVFREKLLFNLRGETRGESYFGNDDYFCL